ncbi:MAG: alpha-glucosidase C-terminal domain-containing protein [Anaerolineae bacterium]|nr:alpha-glucosidase C-terminal domain-containing protein [Anaerolineae bacterium]
MEADWLIHTPEWVKDAVFYQIFPDRFATSERLEKPSNLEPWDQPPTRHGFKGGDLWGVVERLDYLQDLGVTAIYFNPIFCSTANHRYHTHDYYHVDPLLGGDEAFAALLHAAHARSIRVVLDGVFNHASRGFFQFNHVLENGPSSPYRDWFIVRGFPLRAYSRKKKPRYETWWGLRALPKLNTDNPQVYEFLMKVAEYWLRQGIDGWRLDVPLEIRTPGFWAEFRQRVKAINPQAYIVAEIWDEATGWLHGEHFDALMNYVLNRACLGFFGGADLDTAWQPGGYLLEPLTGRQFATEIERLLALNHWEVTTAQMNLLSSHDMPRFLTLVNGNKRRLQLATLFQMTFPGAPCVYYGDEVGLEGAGDPDCRRGFPWEREKWDHDLRDWFQRCIRLRHAHPALRRGAFRTLVARKYVYVFSRSLGEETAIVALNAGKSRARVSVPLDRLASSPAALRDLFSGHSYPVQQGMIALNLPPLSGTVIA